MSKFNIAALAEYFKDENKSIVREENHYHSNDVISVVYSDGVIKGIVQASMKA